MIEQLSIQFDYAALDSETRIVVQQRTSEIKTLMRRAASDIIEIGQKLIDVKSLLEDNSFSGWLKSEFAWSRRTAYNFIGVAECFGRANFAQLDVAASALYLLAAPSTPDAAREEAIARAEQGEAISYSTARTIVQEHKEPRQSFQCVDCHEWFSEPVWHCLHCDHHWHDAQNRCSNCQKPRRDAAAAEPGDYPYLSAVPFVPTAEDYADPYGDDDPELFEVAAPRVSHQLINQSTSNEWYTPAPFIEAARAVMGRIDLDPASCEYANRTVQALVYYTQDDDGYAQQWHGAVWLNPPYGKEEGENESNQARWSRKLLDEYEARRVREAVLLVNAVTGNQWFRPLKAFPICFPDSRIRFYNEETDAGQPTHSNALVYIGPNVARFVEAFSQFGPVMMPVRVEGERVCLKM